MIQSYAVITLFITHNTVYSDFTHSNVLTAAEHESELKPKTDTHLEQLPEVLVFFFVCMCMKLARPQNCTQEHNSGMIQVLYPTNERPCSKVNTISLAGNKPRISPAINVTFSVVLVVHATYQKVTLTWRRDITIVIKQYKSFHMLHYISLARWLDKHWWAPANHLDCCHWNFL